MVYGVRRENRKERRTKKRMSRLFDWLFNKLVRTPIPPNASDFRLFDRRVVEALKQLPERSRFMKGLYSWTGFRSIDEPTQRDAILYLGSGAWVLLAMNALLALKFRCLCMKVFD